MKNLLLILSIFIFSCGPVEKQKVSVQPKKDSTANKDSMVKKEVNAYYEGMDSLRSKWSDTTCNFLNGKKISKAVAYSFLSEIEEYDSVPKGKRVQIFPQRPSDRDGYCWVYKWEKDKHPQADLNSIQIKKFLTLVNDTASYFWGEAGCNYPRNAIVFYDEHNSIIGSYKICFECSMARSRPEFARMRFGLLSENALADLRKLFEELNVSILSEFDFYKIKK